MMSTDGITTKLNLFTPTDMRLTFSIDVQKAAEVPFQAVRRTHRDPRYDHQELKLKTGFEIVLT